MNEPERFHQDLDVELTREELGDRGDRLAGLIEEHRKIEEEKAKATSGFNGRLKANEGQQTAIAEAIRTRREKRPVECHRLWDRAGGRVAEIRTDTGQCVSSRPITKEELERLEADAAAEAEYQISEDTRKAIEQFERQIERSNAKAAFDLISWAERNRKVLSPGSAGRLMNGELREVDALLEAGVGKVADVADISMKAAEKFLEALRREFIAGEEDIIDPEAEAAAS